MSDLYVEYEPGEWAVWSTVVEDWTATGLSEHDLVVRAGERAMERAKKDAREHIEAVKDGDEYYTRHHPDEETIDELRDAVDD